MELKDKTKFRNYFRMDSITLKKLLELIGPLITRQSVVRELISPGGRSCNFSPKAETTLSIIGPKSRMKRELTNRINLESISSIVDTKY
ncbi:hypothetical protein P5V15_008405 [Pogonomyrmex californicus]